MARACPLPSPRKRERERRSDLDPPVKPGDDGGRKAPRAPQRGRQPRSSRALVMTLTEESAMAAAATMGESSSPRLG